MNFIEGRIDIEPGQLRLLAELLADLNQACRMTFSRSIRDKLPPKVMTEPWAKKTGCFECQVGLSLMLTSHQDSMVVRQAKNLRKTANARAKWLSEHHAKLAQASSGKLNKLSSELSKIEGQLAKPAPMAKPGLRKRLTEQIAKKRNAAESTKGRQGRLLASAKSHKKLADSGLASQVFGGAKLASQVHRLDEESSPFKGKSAWDQAWTESRNQSWLFEGKKAAASANSNAKMDIDDGGSVSLVEWWRRAVRKVDHGIARAGQDGENAGGLVNRAKSMLLWLDDQGLPMTVHEIAEDTRKGSLVKKEARSDGERLSSIRRMELDELTEWRGAEQDSVESLGFTQLARSWAVDKDPTARVALSEWLGAVWLSRGGKRSWDSVVVELAIGGAKMDAMHWDAFAKRLVTHGWLNTVSPEKMMKLLHSQESSLGLDSDTVGLLMAHAIWHDDFEELAILAERSVGPVWSVPAWVAASYINEGSVPKRCWFRTLLL